MISRAENRSEEPEISTLRNKYIVECLDKMKVRASEATMWDLDDHLEDISGVDVLSSLPSNDIWKKFDLLDSPLPDTMDIDPDACISDLMDLGCLDDGILELELQLDSALTEAVKQANEIRHHDCMWAGLCMSKEHKPEIGKPSVPSVINMGTTTRSTPLHQVAVLGKTQTQHIGHDHQQQSVQQASPATGSGTPAKNAGRSLLLSSRVQQQSASTPAPKTATTAASVLMEQIGARPDSPPSSDDDDQPRFKHETSLFSANKTLQLLNDSLSECDNDEDSDLCDYFEESDVFVGPEPAAKEPVRTTFANEFDHSYHKGKGMQLLRMDHLGVQTPSDSEEEIDVVSVTEKQINNTNRCSSTVLPTNPSMRDRQKLQRTVASAINGKQEFSQRTGIKTRLPLRIPNLDEPTPRKKRQASKERRPGGRGVKRAKLHHYKNDSPGSSPNKKRNGYGQSSDSETECSEKRSLHNNMERQRRVDLRNAFDDLRVLVPKVSCKDRAAKVIILQEAAVFCDTLTFESKAMTKQVSDLRKHQERLRSKVSQLRRSLAAKR